MTKQKTIRQPCSLSGISLHHGLMSRITFLPARVNSGVNFQFQNELVPLNPGSLFDSESKFTSLTNGRIKIDCVEHVLSALSGLGITNLRIVLEADNSPPWLDGSSWPFVKSLLAAGLDEQGGQAEEVSLDQMLFLSLENSDSYIKIFPSEDLTIDCIIRFDNLIGQQRFIFPFSSGGYLIDVCRARSFLPYPLNNNLEKTRKRLPGFSWDGVNSNVLVYNDSEYLVNLRYENEPVRHKILDFLGDMSVLGKMIKGYIILYKPGHQLNAMLVKKVYELQRITDQVIKPTTSTFVPSNFSSDQLSHFREVDAPDGWGDRSMSRQDSSY